MLYWWNWCDNFYLKRHQIVTLFAQKKACGIISIIIWIIDNAMWQCSWYASCYNHDPSCDNCSAHFQFHQSQFFFRSFHTMWFNEQHPALMIRRPYEVSFVSVFFSPFDEDDVIKIQPIAINNGKKVKKREKNRLTNVSMPLQKKYSIHRCTLYIYVEQLLLSKPVWLF